MDKTKQIKYLRYEVENSLHEAFSSVKNKISGDLLIFEMSILYNNKIYDEKSLIIQDFISNLSDDIDNVISEHQVKCFNAIKKLLKDIGDNNLLNHPIEVDKEEQN